MPTEPTLYQESGCLIHRVPGIDAITEAEACVKCGAERRWVVPVERCEHDIRCTECGWTVPGAGIGGDDE